MITRDAFLNGTLFSVKVDRLGLKKLLDYAFEGPCFKYDRKSGISLEEALGALALKSCDYNFHNLKADINPTCYQNIVGTLEKAGYIRRVKKIC
jgi:hypothetical protein